MLKKFTLILALIHSASAFAVLPPPPPEEQGFQGTRSFQKREVYYDTKKSEYSMTDLSVRQRAIFNNLYMAHSCGSGTGYAPYSLTKAEFETTNDPYCKRGLCLVKGAAWQKRTCMGLETRNEEEIAIDPRFDGRLLMNPGYEDEGLKKYQAGTNKKVVTGIFEIWASPDSVTIVEVNKNPNTKKLCEACGADPVSFSWDDAAKMLIKASKEEF